MDGRMKTIAVNRYAQVFDNEKYFAKPYHMDKKGKAGDVLKKFCGDFGVQEHLTFERSG